MKKKIQIELSGRGKEIKIRFLLYFSSFTIIAVLLIFTFLLWKRNQIIRDYKVQSEIQVEYLRGVVDSHFQSIKSDLLFLPELNELLRFKNLPNSDDKRYIEKEFLEFARSKKVYDQIRYIDIDGYEMVRINLNRGFPYIVENEDLQNKGDRYYFTETLKLKEGQVYVSPLDLNKENGIVDIPWKPMIRFGTPLYNQSKEIKGVLILNYLADTFLEDLKVSTRNQPGTFSLVNDDGFWLYNDNPIEEWIFMYPDKNPIGLRESSPDFWTKITANEQTHSFFFEQSLCTVLDMNPLELTPGINNRPHWYLVNRISFDEMNASWGDFLFVLLISIILLSIITFFPFWLASRAVV